MFRMNALNIDLLTLQEDSFEATYILRDEYFNSLDNVEIKGGDVCSEVTLTRVSSTEFSLSLKIAGAVIVPCDRCLDEMDQEISSTDKIFVKFGAEYADEGDNLIIVPEDEGDINVAWIMYEYIALAIPMKHVHAPGKCNKTMSGKLNKYLRTSADDMDEMEPVDDSAEDESNIVSDEENDKPIDPRWSELQKLL